MMEKSIKTLWKKKSINDVLPRRKRQSHPLAHVPVDSRAAGIAGSESYEASMKAKVRCKAEDGTKHDFTCSSIDISENGISLLIQDPEHVFHMQNASKIWVNFTIPAGAMPEGYEMEYSMKSKLDGVKQANGNYVCSVSFEQTLSRYLYTRKSAGLRVVALTMMALVTLAIVAMRAVSILYFRFNPLIYAYSIITAVYLISRYLLAAFYRPVPVNEEFTPAVSIIIPCFNEEQWIHRTIESCLDQDYPMDKLEVIVVDDCSTDDSFQRIRQTADRLYELGEEYETRDRLHFIRLEQNGGKRQALAKGVEAARFDLVVFVDSDSFLDPCAIRHLVQPFQDEKMGGVTGRTDVANTYTNALTRMQSARYYIAFRVMKAAESLFDSVTCLSGPISCYRRELIEGNMDNWLNQSFLGHKATFGDDRAMTNMILRKHRTAYQDTAICSTIVPNRHSQFLKQQMRWKRSWLRESTTAARFIWKKEPFMALFFYMGFIVPLAAPLVFVYNLLYVPIFMGIFPTTFLSGLLLMALLMSFAHMYYRCSSNWKYSLFFCLYYNAVLLWQMPVAWFTFWKSTWGTRMTPQDVLAAEKRKKKSKSTKVDSLNA